MIKISDDKNIIGDIFVKNLLNCSKIFQQLVKTFSTSKPSVYTPLSTLI